MTVDEAVERALAGEPGLRARRTDAEKARGLELQAGLRPNPSAAVMEQFEPEGTDSQRRVEVQWPLDLFRRAGRLRVAQSELTAVALNISDRERLLAAAVRLAYGDVAASIRDLAVSDDLVDSTARQSALLAARVREGGTPALERNVVEVELRRLQAERLLLAGRLDRKMIELKRLLGLGPVEPLMIRETIEQLVAHDGTRTPGSGAADVSGRADVKEGEARITVAEAAIDRARRNGRIDLALAGAYTRMDAGFPQFGVNRSGEPARVRGLFHYLSAGVTVSIPLRNRNQGEVAAAEAERAGAAERLASVRLAADADVAASAARDERARAALAIYQDGARDLSRQNLDVVRQTYELGRATVFDALAEQRRYLELERSYSDTLREAYEARVALRRAVGDVR
ncbi:MAG: TolC family protein [Acidobacteriota bacterium]